MKEITMFIVEINIHHKTIVTTDLDQKYKVI
jgi:hypothetical protein